LPPNPGQILPKGFSQAQLRILHLSAAQERNFCSLSILFGISEQTEEEELLGGFPQPDIQLYFADVY
jgi:hypothetical protein